MPAVGFLPGQGRGPGCCRSTSGSWTSRPRVIGYKIEKGIRPENYRAHHRPIIRAGALLLLPKMKNAITTQQSQDITSETEQGRNQMSLGINRIPTNPATKMGKRHKT
jgi:hypothetical protein